MSPADRGRGASARRSTRRRPPLEQLAFELGPERPRWSFSRLVLRSPHRDRILERLEFVRRFFHELDGTTVRIGLARKRGILGWASLEPDRPGVWVRPRRLDYFTVAHEFTHLLQARALVPGGERQCDLWALSRSPHLVDTPPGYLKLPRPLREKRRLTPEHAAVLCDMARAAIEAREGGDRRYLKRFEQDVARAWTRGEFPGPAETPAAGAADPMHMEFESADEEDDAGVRRAASRPAADPAGEPPA